VRFEPVLNVAHGLSESQRVLPAKP
jgi:hypothetical protein